MGAELLEHYLADSSRRGAAPAGAYTGAAGGAPCGDLIRVSVTVQGGRIGAASFDAEGCGATLAAGAAVTERVEGESVLEAARVGPEDVSAALGGLSSQGRHAADLAADALHRALAALAASPRPIARPPGAGERVLVAMSGGVDSTVAALLERERGAEVVAVTLKLWADRRTDGERSCCSPEAVVGARAIAHRLGVPHLTLDLEERFRATVVESFVRGYAAGQTPNPCVVCNGGLRIDAMLELAARLGCSGLATGHYARLADDGDGPLLAAPADAAKDQTYMLSGLRPGSLARLRFPLAGLTKAQVRELAAGAGLAIAGKRESQDLCFLSGEGKRSFLARHAGLGERPGEVVDVAGRVLGRHPGHHNFTVGQRRGLGLAGGRPLYVLRTDPRANRVVVGARGELATRRVRVRDAVLHRDGSRVDRVKLRYRSRPIACSTDVTAGRHPELWIELAEPAHGVAPGQTACLMDGELVVGHATIAA
ncbi:MAG TPA: tRNA 2-thiouridine(34) synthase MnmA [Solirubrobacterales bacterium]|nr:tRNA 2-thiouridine(34) synthase MnmA [Solirubrobacterales bacterium]